MSYDGTISAKLDACAAQWKDIKLAMKAKSESDEENVKRVMQLMEKGDANAFYQLGGYYGQGILGLPQDEAKANELYLKAGELGCAEAYYNLGNSYNNGR